MWSPSMREEKSSLWEIMDRRPETIAVFLRYRFICVGCVIAPYHRLIDACAEHGADLEEVCSALEDAIRRGAETNKASGPAQDD